MTTPISGLPSTSTPGGADLVPIVQSGTTKRTTLAEIIAQLVLPSPAFTGTPTAPTAAADTNTTQVATTGFVIGQAATTTPLIDGTAAVGTSKKYAREDHKHPTDTTRAALAGSSSQNFSANDLTCSSQNGGQLAGFRNKVINGNFRLNQRAVATASTAYGAGVYTLDRWKAGTGGVTMSYADSGSYYTVTITAGTLRQVVEDVNVSAGVYTLSWSGTAQARISINGAAPSGAYASSPITTSSATEGQAITIEFSTGTVTKVQLELGSTATPFEWRSMAGEMVLAMRYYESGETYLGIPVTGVSPVTTQLYRVIKRTTPTVTVTADTALSGTAAGTVLYSGGGVNAIPNARKLLIWNPNTGSTIGCTWSADAEL